MPSRWIEFVRKWAKDHDTTYACALSQPDCKNEYRAKYGNRKKLPMKKERELMGMEDINVSKKVITKKKKKPFIIEEDEEELDKVKETKKKALSELQKKQEEKKRLIELSRMMGEDYNVIPTKSEKSSNETIDQLLQHFKKIIEKNKDKFEEYSLSSLKELAKLRIDAGFTIDDENTIKKMSREELRSFYKSVGYQDTLEDNPINIASKNSIIDNLFGDYAFQGYANEENWKDIKDELTQIKSKNIEKKSKKTGIKISEKVKNFLDNQIKNYLYRPQLLELSRKLGVIPSKKDTKIDTLPLIFNKIEEGFIDFNDLFKGIRAIEKIYTNEKAIKFKQKLITYSDIIKLPRREIIEYTTTGLKRNIDFGFGETNWNKNFGNVNDPTDYNKHFGESK